MELEYSLQHSPVPILSEYDPIHNPTYHFLKIIYNIIFPSAPLSPKWSLPLRFPNQNAVKTSPIPINATLATHFVILNFITRIILGEQ